MESLIAAQRKWERQNGLEKTIEDVQAVIDLLTKTRDDVASGMYRKLYVCTTH